MQRAVVAAASQGWRWDRLGSQRPRSLQVGAPLLWWRTRQERTAARVQPGMQPGVRLQS